jgi:tetrahydromethanopterin S-methyltransferase subunit G
MIAGGKESLESREKGRHNMAILIGLVLGLILGILLILTLPAGV